MAHIIQPSTPKWSDIIAHLERVGMLRHALTEGQPKAGAIYIGAWVDDASVGHISLRSPSP